MIFTIYTKNSALQGWTSRVCRGGGGGTDLSFEFVLLRLQVGHAIREQHHLSPVSVLQVAVRRVRKLPLPWRRAQVIHLVINQSRLFSLIPSSEPQGSASSEVADVCDHGRSGDIAWEDAQFSYYFDFLQRDQPTT